MYQNRKYNPDQDDVDAKDEEYPGNGNIEACPVQLEGSVYGTFREDLTFKQQGEI